MKIGITVGVVIAILALVVCLVPLKEAAYTVAVEYQDTETYYEDVPYEDTETYYVDEPYKDTETYTETVPLDYEVVDSDVYYEGATLVFSVTIQNIDSASGTFTIRFSIKVSGTTIDSGTIHLWSKQYSDEKELDLKPGETKTAKHHADYADLRGVDKSCSYEVIPDTKLVEKERVVTKYRQVEKKRTVTKYRQVEKERTVTKERPETHYKKVTLLDYLLHY